MIKVKFCGLRREEDIEAVNRLKPDFAGFVFAKSKRQVSVEAAARLKKQLDPEIKTVAVLVNMPVDGNTSRDPSNTTHVHQNSVFTRRFYSEVNSKQHQAQTLSWSKLKEQTITNTKRNSHSDLK